MSQRLHSFNQRNKQTSKSLKTYKHSFILEWEGLWVQRTALKSRAAQPVGLVSWRHGACMTVVNRHVTETLAPLLLPLITNVPEITRLILSSLYYQSRSKTCYPAFPFVNLHQNRWSLTPLTRRKIRVKKRTLGKGNHQHVSHNGLRPFIRHQRRCSCCNVRFRHLPFGSREKLILMS